MKKNSHFLNRRQFLLGSALSASGIIAADLCSKTSQVQASSPGIITSERMRPQIPYGVASGDISGDRAIIWSRCDRPGRMIVEYSTQPSFQESQRIIGPAALETSDFTARILLSNLPSAAQIFYRVTFQDLTDSHYLSAPVSGTFRTPPSRNQSIFFAWSGCTGGQGWGINPDWGGIKIYETIRQLNIDFFIHCGDIVYADNPLQAEVTLDDGRIWKNIVTPERSKVAETLAEFRGNYIYNLLDENIRRFNAEIPLLAQWDDHETRNNWYPGQMLMEDDRYTVKSCDLLAARAKKAFLEYLPIGLNGDDPERIYRSFQHGKSLEIFMLDARSYRGANSANRQPIASEETAFLGSRQMSWLKQQLQASTATWKVIASDMPLGIVVADSNNTFENATNGDGPALGRELEIAELLQFIQQNNIQNVVWLSSDLHYAVAIYYDPAKAQFSNFKPFWEFSVGPLHGSNYGPNPVDNTFGPQVMFQTATPDNKIKQSPFSHLLFFGTVKIDGETEVLTVSFRDLEGKMIYTIDLEPEAYKPESI